MKHDHETIEYSHVYATCSACRHKKQVEPTYTTLACDTNYVDKVKCTFSDIIYNQVINKRFGVTSCCPEDYAKWKIKNDLLSVELIKHDSPDLPEPIVEFCCIDKFGTVTNCIPDCTCSTQACTCTDPFPCGCPGQPAPNCSCSSVNCGCTTTSCGCTTQSDTGSLCICHTYKFNIVAGALADATGNADPTRDNTVYAKYKPCGEEGYITVPYTEASEAETLCTVKVPELFWYKNDVKTDFDTVSGGNLKVCGTCEPLNCLCKCTASECSPHDCHTYTFDVVAEMLADAVGNTESHLNGRVYFGYIPCAETCSVTESYTTVDSQEYCVLGTPVLGWYKNDVWVDYDSIPEGNLTRGAVCEVDNDCDGCCAIPCNNCNTCN